MPVLTSGREDLPLAERIGLLRAALLQEPLIGISEATRATSQTIHDLKLTVGWVRNTISLYEQALQRGQTDETLAKGANTMLSWIEAYLLAWNRGGHAEFERVRAIYLEATRRPQ